MTAGERGHLVETFLDCHGWGEAARDSLAGDASFRRYLRLSVAGRSAVLMDAPPAHEDVVPFLAIARYLRRHGLSAPKVLAADESNGLVLLEDLGDAAFSRVVDAGGDAGRLYGAAIDLLLALHRLVPPAFAPPYDDARLMTEALLFTDWYLPALDSAPRDRDRGEFESLWCPLFDLARAGAQVLCLCDYHADNLMWLAARRGAARVGLLDFQDAVVGPAAYDLVSLLEDARRDVPAPLAAAMIRRYLEGSAIGGPAEAAFRTAYAILGAQRNTKIIGIFTRLYARDRKPRYLSLIPRVWRHLERDLSHPALAELKSWFDARVPSEMRARPPALATA